jgi:hypothetical protein
MYRKNINIIVFIIYNFFLAISSNIIRTNFKYENLIMLLVLCLLSVINYYIKVEDSVILTIFIDFIYSSIILYRHLIKLQELQIGTFYWIAIIPITSYMIYIFKKQL